MNDEGVEEVARRVHAEFDRLDAEVACRRKRKTFFTDFYVPLSFIHWLIGILTK